MPTSLIRNSLILALAILPAAGDLALAQSIETPRPGSAEFAAASNMSVDITGDSAMSSGASMFSAQPISPSVSDNNALGAAPVLTGKTQVQMEEMQGTQYFQNRGILPAGQMMQNQCSMQAMQHNCNMQTMPCMHANNVCPHSMHNCAMNQGCNHQMQQQMPSSNGGDLGGLASMFGLENGNNGQMMTQAIGAVGAAALLSNFLGNGGVGGTIRSLGWNNTRIRRGP